MDENNKKHKSQNLVDYFSLASEMQLWNLQQIKNNFFGPHIIKLEVHFLSGSPTHTNICFIFPSTFNICFSECMHVMCMYSSLALCLISFNVSTPKSNLTWGLLHVSMSDLVIPRTEFAFWSLLSTVVLWEVKRKSVKGGHCSWCL